MVEQLEEEFRVGTPWSILPIKNKKYAKDLTEVHLSDKGLTSLEKFEEFPNLEEIWLNNNKVSFFHFFRLTDLFQHSYKISMTSWATSAASKSTARTTSYQTSLG